MSPRFFLTALALASAMPAELFAQDVPGIEICTVEKAMDRRTSCLQSNVDFLQCTETPVRPLIEQLDFIEDKSRWGYKFRFGVFKIDDHDLEVIRSAMTG